VNGIDLSRPDLHISKKVHKQCGDGVSAVQFPHLSVLDNLTLAPRRVLGKSKQESEKQARFYLDKVGLAERQGLIQELLVDKSNGCDRA